MDEYNSLLAQQSAKQAEYNACSSRIGRCDYLLGRLRPVKEAVAAKKREFDSIQKEDKRITKSKQSWKGENYRSYQSKGAELLNEDNSFYIRTMDHILDSLNNEITRIENERLSEYGLLGRIGAALNSLANKIENFFN